MCCCKQQLTSSPWMCFTRFSQNIVYKSGKADIVSISCLIYGKKRQYTCAIPFIRTNKWINTTLCLNTAPNCIHQRCIYISYCFFHILLSLIWAIWTPSVALVPTQRNLNCWQLVHSYLTKLPLRSNLYNFNRNKNVWKCNFLALITWKKIKALHLAHVSICSHKSLTEIPHMATELLQKNPGPLLLVMCIRKGCGKISETCFNKTNWQMWC